MRFSIHQPLSIYEKGNKTFSEDYIHPPHKLATTEDRLFIVSDGHKGESNHAKVDGGTISQAVSKAVANYFESKLHDGDADAEHIESAIRHAQMTLQAQTDTIPEEEMSKVYATFALLYFGKTGVGISWVGSCKVFYYNKAHDTLADSQGWEQAFPVPNETTSIKLDNEVKVNFRYIPYSDLNQGDYFLLFSGGLTKEVSQNQLLPLIQRSREHGQEKVLEEIQADIFSAVVNDDYSGYLIQVGEAATENSSATPTEPESKAEETKQEASTTATASTQGGKELDEDPQKDQNSDPSGKRMAYLVGAIAVIIITLLLIVAFNENSEKPFKNIIARSDTLLEHGKQAYLNEEYLRGDRNFQQARIVLDSATRIAENDEQRTMIAMRQEEVNAYLDLSPQMGNIIDLPLDQLTATAAQYIKEGFEFLNAGNQQAALQAFRNAQRKLEENPDPEIDFPAEAVAKVYAHVAEKLFAQADRDCDRVVQYYQSAFELYTPESDSAPQWYSQAQTNAEACTATLASTGNDESSRGLDLPAARRQIESTVQQPIASNDPPAASNQRTAAPSENANMRGSQSSAPNESQLAEMRTRLSEGKRLFIEAKEQNSPFQYRTSAEKLIAAGPMLDGAGAYLLAYMYHGGLGVQQDDAKALQYAQLSARKNWAAGEYFYAHLLLMRKNRPDSTLAASYLQKSANQYYSDAVQRLQELE